MYQGAHGTWYMFSRGKVARAMRLTSYMKYTGTTLTFIAVYYCSVCKQYMYIYIYIYIYRCIQVCWCICFHPCVTDYLIFYLLYLRKVKLALWTPWSHMGYVTRVTPHSQLTHFWRRKKIFNINKIPNVKNFTHIVFKIDGFTSITATNWHSKEAY